MYVSNVIDLNTSNDYDNITDLNTTNDYNNCTINEINIEIFMPSLLPTIPYDLSFLCLMSLKVYTLIKPLFNKKYIPTII